jgi:site-specific DNA recombinase
MKAAIYCRVSTDNQEREGTSLQTQLEGCLDFCKTKGYDVASRFSEAYSGLSLERPEMDKLRDLVKERTINVIVCYSLDRLSRDPTHGVIITQELEKHSVKLEAVTEDVDNSELGKLINYIRGFASKVEAEKIRERTMRGKRAILAAGDLPQGTGVGLYGYEWNSETKRREIIISEADVVREIFTRASRNESLLSIAQRLNERGIKTKSSRAENTARKYWHSLTIRRMVKNSAYIGITRFKDTILANVTPAIVNEDVFNVANAKLGKPKPQTGKPKHLYLLKEHAFCNICGKSLVGHCLNKKYRYYQCSQARPCENHSKRCNARYIRADELEEMVWEKTKVVFQDPEIILAQLAKGNDKETLDSIEKEIGTLKKNNVNYERRRENLLEAMELGEFNKDEILDRLNRLKRTHLEDENRLDELIKTRDNITGLANAKLKLDHVYEQVIENLKNPSHDIMTLVFDALDIKVYASYNKVEIRGVIPLELALPTTAQTSA